ncbi:heme-binding protein [Methylobacterium indicum]|uniref:SOUL family heme-binding protein n=1 Tax=Methylobacterium indicum TaxID=1775910 RepID=UPI000734A497|nr:heme-binding protein [Methylobacterium indicum]KTS37753.1 heme-binding protein [Methylobacterium indicum]KTS38362.1 heme-binding protein [Methylobacterium indicum]KTS53700.1 heme-binding protein [Methylobacterium indicum]
MDKLAYYAVTLIESVLGVFGIRTFYDQPRYAVVERLDRGVEIRAYEGRVAVETDARGQGGGQGDGEAFGRLFRYITGANRAGDRIAMTAPVEAAAPGGAGGRRIAMTVPVEQGTGGTMRFFLPHAVAAAGAPEPTEAGVRLVRVPPERIAALRFSGRVTPEARAEQERILTEVLATAGKATAAPPFFMGYDPPFAIPFLRRNEVAVRLGE